MDKCWEQRIAEACCMLDSLLAEQSGVQGEQQVRGEMERLLFARLTRVYLDEERIRVRQKLKRKSSQRISRVIHETLGRFLAEQLPECGFHAVDGLLIVTNEENVIAALKCIPDLGSYRTHSWKSTIARFVKQSQKRYGLPPENMLFMVCSLAKSLDAAHAKALIGVEVGSGPAFAAPAYREILQAYVDKYVESIDVLPVPSQQIYFLSAGSHPNALACKLVQGKPATLPERWLRPSASELVTILQSRCRTGEDNPS